MLLEGSRWDQIDPDLIKGAKPGHRQRKFSSAESVGLFSCLDGSKRVLKGPNGTRVIRMVFEDSIMRVFEFLSSY